MADGQPGSQSAIIEDPPRLLALKPVSALRVCRHRRNEYFRTNSPFECLAATTISMLIMQILSELLTNQKKKKKRRKLTVIAAGQFASSTIKI